MLSMPRILIRISILLLCVCLAGHSAQAADNYPWPVDAKPALTSTFCEFRPGHFHSGIDLKVYGSVGIPCRAIADGYIIRLKVSPVGYGKALYLKLNDGKTAVYAHLERFTADLDEMIRKLQHQHGSYALDWFLEDSDTTWFQQGEVVAYSGRSGVKHPHVHFEIRDPGERPLNPLLHGLKAADRFPPTPVKIAVIPLDGASTVEGDCQTRLYTRLVKNHDGVYRSGDDIGVNGRIGIGIEAYDRADAAENLLAIYRVEMYVAEEKRWTTTFDRFSFSETRQIERERDYQLKRKGKGDFHLLFRETGNLLNMGSGDGIIIYDESVNESLEVKIILYDAMGNSSTTQLLLVTDQTDDINRNVGGKSLFDYNPQHNGKFPLEIQTMRNFIRLSGPPGVSSFRINSRWNFSATANPVTGSVSTAWIPPTEFGGNAEFTALDAEGNIIAAADLNIKPAYPASHNVISSKDDKCRVVIPANALYDTMWVSITPEQSYNVGGWIESIYLTEPLDQPVAKKVVIKIAAEGKQFQSGWGLYYFDSRKGWIFLSDSLENGYYVAEALSWERFGLRRDIDKPKIKVITPGKNLNFKDQYPEIAVLITDSTSGLAADGLEMRLDGNIVPAEYDPPIDRLSYKCWRPLSVGKHEVVITAKDRVHNTFEKKIRFNVLP